MAAGRRLAIGAAIVLSVTAYMAYLGGSSSWQYYLTVDECLSLSPEMTTGRMRISGKVSDHSLVIRPDRRAAEFHLVGTDDTLRVSYAGRVPDNLAAARQVVVEGCLRGPGQLQADSLLTRCASKYTSVAMQDDFGRVRPGRTE